MKRLLIFGAGINGSAYLSYVRKFEQEIEVVGFLSNGDKGMDDKGFGIPIYKPELIGQLDYDVIMISNGRAFQVDEIKEQLSELGVLPEKISVLNENTELKTKVLANFNQYSEDSDSRVVWLRNYAEHVKELGLTGNVAECGVNKGEFAYYINKYFSDRKLYLFDTFSGFDSRDIEAERALKDWAFLQSQFNRGTEFLETHEEIVLQRMLHPEQCVVRKGYFPDSAADVDDKFCFVMLDMDLYQPMLAGLHFFYDRMCKDGVILLHDYYHPELPGVRLAVERYESETGQTLCKLPIGDSCSLAVIKR